MNPLRLALRRDHRSYRHRVLWWFRRRFSPEYQRCVAASVSWNAAAREDHAERGTPPMTITPGQMWTLRGGRRG